MCEWTYEILINLPSGKIHNEVNGLVGVSGVAALVISGVALQYPIQTLAGFAGFGYSMLLFSPDMDQNKWSPDRYWFCFRFLLRPYKKIFKHRGKKGFSDWTRSSHNFFLGTFGRALYSMIILPWLAYALYMSSLWPYWIVGMYLSDWLHYAADFLVS